MGDLPADQDWKTSFQPDSGFVEPICFVCSFSECKGKRKSLPKAGKQRE